MWQPDAAGNSGSRAAHIGNAAVQPGGSLVLLDLQGQHVAKQDRRAIGVPVVASVPVVANVPVATGVPVVPAAAGRDRLVVA